MTHFYAHDFDPSAHRTGYIPGTDYTPPYLSRFTVAHPDETNLLRHVNCSLLTTPSVAPTLLALKQHAQSLSYLIAMLSPHGEDDDAVEVVLARAATANNSIMVEAPSTRSITMDNPFDWLDLSRPYTNDADPDHHRPLLDLVNEVQTHHDVLGTIYHCPLTTQTPRNGGRYTMRSGDDDDDVDDENANMRVGGQDGAHIGLGEDGCDKRRPYASHHNLLMHANMCLERLDHEYAGTGGLLSLLPTTVVASAAAGPLDSSANINTGAKDESTESSESSESSESTELMAARNSLVGQWLGFTQQLVGRVHELEAAHASAIYCLSGEAELAPKMAAAGDDAHGPSANPGRWILANAGDDVWSAVHEKLDQVAAADTAQLQSRRAQGVAGERTVLPGSVLPFVDLVTRFYRAPVANSVRGPISVCLAGAPSIRDVDAIGTNDHSTAAAGAGAGAGAAAGAAAPSYAGPSLAASVPFVPASALENRYNHRLEEAGRLARDNTLLTQRLLERTQALSALQRECARLQTLNTALKRTAADSQSDGASRRTRRRRARGAVDSTYRQLADDVDSSSEDE
ncbi:MAG: hypothetical protein STHCBS139747_005879 [Sporothrix thermara]